jgi:hypothetical protein
VVVSSKRTNEFSGAQKTEVFGISKQIWDSHEVLCDIKLLFYVLSPVLHMTSNQNVQLTENRDLV